MQAGGEKPSGKSHVLDVAKWRVSELEAAWVDCDGGKHPYPWFVTHANQCLFCSLIFPRNEWNISFS